VLTIPVTTDGKLLLLEHYRHGLRRISWEFPSGLGEPGETPIEGARRELLEETGYAGDNAQLLGQLAPNPAIQSNYMSVVLITGAKSVAKPALEPGEELKVHLLNIDQVSDMVADGRMYHALNVAAFSLAKAKGVFDKRS
jgi:8-oxo-dGTP pyrophosphatase MutT (NUDIX family)